MKNSNKIVTLFIVLFSALGLGLDRGVVSTQASTNTWQDPATVRIVDQTCLNSLIDTRADGNTTIEETINGVLREYTPLRETYSPNDRQWQGLVSTVSTGNRLWSTWYTGGSGEPRQFNYVVVSYSDDQGQTWVDPYIIIDHEDSNHVGVSLGVPNFWMDGDVLCLTYLQYGTWIVRFHDPDAGVISNVVIDQPVKYTNSKIHKGPTFLKDEDGQTILAYASEDEAGDKHISTTRIYVSKDQGSTWNLRASLPSSAPSNRLYPESQIVELKRGKWMVVSRLERGAAGGIETAVSNDYGMTWEPYQNNLSEPFIGPGSKTHITQLSSGNILMVNHDTTSSRSSLFAYLSEDGGETWPYKLSIDQRNDVSYPYVFENDGLIYVSWDKGRYLEKELRLSVICEEDIKAGYLVSTQSKEKQIISKLNAQYKDIVSINNAFEVVLNYPVGTPSSEIRGALPETITVTDNEGTDYVLTGVWKSGGFKQDVAGSYFFSFSTTLPATLSDTYNLLGTRVVLTEVQNTSWILIAAIAGGFVVVGSGLFIIIFLRKKRYAIIH